MSHAGCCGVFDICSGNTINRSLMSYAHPFKVIKSLSSFDTSSFHLEERIVGLAVPGNETCQRL